MISFRSENEIIIISLSQYFVVIERYKGIIDVLWGGDINRSRDLCFVRIALLK